MTFDKNIVFEDQLLSLYFILLIISMAVCINKFSQAEHAVIIALHSVNRINNVKTEKNSIKINIFPKFSSKKLKCL